MAVLTAIQQQKNDPERYSIFVDKEYSFSLSAQQLLEEKLHVSMELSDTDIQKFKQKSQDGKLLQRCYDKLARRPHSEKEMRDYLRRKQASEEAIEYIIAKLYELKLLDDHSFAEQWIKNRRELKHRSTRALQSELMQKGVARETINQLLSDADEDNYTALQRMAEKKARQARYKDPEKLTSYLMGKGFNYGDVKKVVSSLLDSSPDF